jgi:hypothetical protein
MRCTAFNHQATTVSPVRSYSVSIVQRECRQILHYTYPLAVLWGELQLLVEGLSDGLEDLLDLEGRERLECPISHRFAEGFELHFADEPGEDGVTPAGVVEAQHDVGGPGRHVGNENARKWCALR